MNSLIGFTNLHVHSSIGSQSDSMARIDDLFRTAKELGQTSIALSDHGSAAGLVDSRKASKKYGVKYIPGIEAYFVDDAKDQEKLKRHHLVVLAKNEIGYKNLLQLNYQGFVNRQYVPVANKVFPRITWDMLEKYHEGIICLTACSAGILGNELMKRDEKGIWDKSNCYNNAVRIALRLKDIFKEDLYLELQPHAFEKYKVNKKTGERELDETGKYILLVSQTYINKQLLKMSRELDIPIVATCDVHYIKKEDAKAHSLLMAINDKKPLSDPTRHSYGVDEFYMKSGYEVSRYFTELFDDQIAHELCNNTLVIANKCQDSTYIDSTTIRFPKFDCKLEQDYQEFLVWRKTQDFNVAEDNAYLRFKCIKNFKKMYGHLDDDTRKKYRDRLIEEIKVLELKNFASYILITSDFICKAEANGIRIGIGRGSVGGSLVANVLGIHKVDPMRYGLIFERFLNKEKTAFPDIDTDISPKGREWVEQYIIKRYGERNVAHVSNLSRMTPKVVIKDVARSLEIGGNKSAAFKIANDITDSVPDDAKTFDDALVASKPLQELCVKNPEVELYCRKLVGLEKNYATHAAGIVISDVDLSTIVPLRYDKDGTLSIQYEKERVEAVGLIKMDLLGLEDLAIIDQTIKNVKDLGIDCLKPEQLFPYDDKVVWNMISKGITMGVFQMGSTHMKNLCKRIKPQSIEDLSLINALGRPSGGQASNKTDQAREIYINRRNKIEKIGYKYECLREPLKDTLGVCVYEEQLAKMAKHIAGWDLNKADSLRKFTKLKGKNPELAKKLEEDFVNDASKHSSLKKAEAQDIWTTVIEPFAGYGFNCSHAVAYSINGYNTAYYKCHYPSAFMAAVLRSEVEGGGTKKDEKIKELKDEARRIGLKIVSPDINKSDKYFSVLDRGTIVMGLAAVKGVGEKAVEDIIESRKAGRFVSFYDFLHRTNSHIIKKNVIQSLAKAGAFDSFGDFTRRAICIYCADMRTKINKFVEKQSNLIGFDFVRDDIKDEYTKKEILEGEKEALGEYLSGNLSDVYSGFFTNNGTQFKVARKMAEKSEVRIEAIVDSVSSAKIKSGKNKGNEYGTCNLIDVNNDTMQMKIWSDKWNYFRSRVSSGKQIKVVCRINIWNDVPSLIFERADLIKETKNEMQ